MRALTLVLLACLLLWAAVIVPWFLPLKWALASAGVLVVAFYSICLYLVRCSFEPLDRKPNPKKP